MNSVKASGGSLSRKAAAAQERSFQARSFELNGGRCIITLEQNISGFQKIIHAGFELWRDDAIMSKVKLALGIPDEVAIYIHSSSNRTISELPPH